MTLALIVVGSPRPTSFAHAMARRAGDAFAERGSAVSVRDLYGEGFDPVARSDEAVTVGPTSTASDHAVAQHRELLSAATYLVVAHPNWWGKPPAIMAGWLDRVFVPGVAFRLPSRDGLPTPLLAVRGLLVLNTGDTAPERERAVFGDPLDLIWRRCVGTYLGDAAVERVVASPLGTATPDVRESWLTDVHHAVGRLADQE